MNIKAYLLTYLLTWMLLNFALILSIIFDFQIAELKRGAEIIVCTPGRMIDMLGANSGEFAHLDLAGFFIFIGQALTWNTCCNMISKVW